MRKLVLASVGALTVASMAMFNALAAGSADPRADESSGRLMNLVINTLPERAAILRGLSDASETQHRAFSQCAEKLGVNESMDPRSLSDDATAGLMRCSEIAQSSDQLKAFRLVADKFDAREDEFWSGVSASDAARTASKQYRECMGSIADGLTNPVELDAHLSAQRSKVAAAEYAKVRETARKRNEQCVASASQVADPAVRAAVADFVRSHGDLIKDLRELAR